MVLNFGLPYYRSIIPRNRPRLFPPLVRHDAPPPSPGRELALSRWLPVIAQRSGGLLVTTATISTPAAVTAL